MNENVYQAMPVQGRLSTNLNLSPEILLERIEDFEDSAVYSYIVDTVEYEDGRLYQTGSGPNFQGDLVTLCSCKHNDAGIPRCRVLEGSVGRWVYELSGLGLE